MQRLYVFVMCGVAGVLSAMSALPAHAQFAPTVVFSELNWGGSGRGIADEWFEFANVGAEPVDVGGWSVTGMATGGGVMTLPQGAIIPAGGQRGDAVRRGHAAGRHGTGPGLRHRRKRRWFRRRSGASSSCARTRTLPASTT
mgnify:CR=1 FL=1